MRLGENPKVQQLAHDLGLSRRGDSLVQIRQYALDRVRGALAAFPGPVADLDTLRRVLADRFRLRVEFINADADIERIADEQADFHRWLARRLHEEFVEGETEGITLERDDWNPVRFRYLAVVDARGRQASRAFFTAIHEITHLLVHPEQMAFPGFRRTPSAVEISKDPLESVVDHVAGHVGFYAPVFRPTLDDAIRREGDFTFACLDAARLSTTPPPSLQATALASISLVSDPVLFLHVDLARKKAEERALRSGQHSFDFAERPPKPDLRAVTAAPNEAAKRGGLVIHPHIRVPARSMISQAFDETDDVELRARENQAWWENSTRGRLPELPLDVQATRRGSFVYGLIRPA